MSPYPTVRERLLQNLTDVEARLWMHREHQALGGRSPAQAVGHGDSAAVHTLIDRMEAGEIV